MLILGREKDQTVWIEGGIELTVINIAGDEIDLAVKMGGHTISPVTVVVDEATFIDDEIEVKVTKICGTNKVKVGITAPDRDVHRMEVYQQILREGSRTPTPSEAASGPEA